VCPVATTDYSGCSCISNKHEAPTFVHTEVHSALPAKTFSATILYSHFKRKVHEKYVCRNFFYHAFSQAKFPHFGYVRSRIPVVPGGWL
jgi:hypothetical protein